MKRLFTLLTLLVAVVTGIWATDATYSLVTYEIVDGAVVFTDGTATVTLTRPGKNMQSPDSKSRGLRWQNSNVITVTVADGYKVNSVTLTSGKNGNSVDKIEYTLTDGQNALNGSWDKAPNSGKQDSYKWTAATGNNYKTWEISNVGETGDIYISGISVNYETAAAVVTPPTITTDLMASYDVTIGRSITLSVIATNATSYQWFSGETAISGATSASYKYTPEAEGSATFYCVVSNENGSTNSQTATVTAGKWKPITTARSWNFTKGGDGTAWASAQAAASGVWGGPDSSQRYNNVNALKDEELNDGTNPLKGLEGIYFTAPATKILLGGKDSSSKCLQTNGNGISALVVGCSAKDKITIRFCASGKDKTVTITSDQMDGTYVSNSTDRTNEKSASVKEAGDVVLNIPNSVRLYEIKVTPYVAVTDFALSAEAVTVEEYENVTVSGKDFNPSNATDKTLNWTSADEKVATVKDGVITGVKAGITTITATSVDGPSKTVEVTVTPCAPKNLSIEMTSNSDAKAPKVESGKTYTLTAKVQGYGLTYQWASKATAKGSYANISGATAQTYEATAVELGSKFYKVTVTNAQGSAVAEYEVKTVVPLQAFTIANEDGTGGINYKALDADEPQVKVLYQLAKADQEIDLIIPDSVEYAGLTYAVTTVGEEAFVNDNTIESLTTTSVLKEIGARAFMFCINLEEVNLADGIETIGDAAFFGCNAFTSFNIPGTVKYVGYKAFAECAGLTDIYYDGTKAQWNALPNIGMAGIAKSVTIHFNDGETENGKGNIVGISNANADEAQKDGKFVENGQVVIYKNGKKYNAAGAEIK